MRKFTLIISSFRIFFRARPKAINYVLPWDKLIEFSPRLCSWKARSTTEYFRRNVWKLKMLLEKDLTWTSIEPESITRSIMVQFTRHLYISMINLFSNLCRLAKILNQSYIWPCYFSRKQKTHASTIAIFVILQSDVNNFKKTMEIWCCTTNCKVLAMKIFHRFVHFKQAPFHWSSIYCKSNSRWLWNKSGIFQQACLSF